MRHQSAIGKIGPALWIALLSGSFITIGNAQEAAVIPLPEDPTADVVVYDFYGSPDGNPEFATVLKVVRALGLELHAVAGSSEAEPVSES